MSGWLKNIMFYELTVIYFQTAISNFNIIIFF